MIFLTLNELISRLNLKENDKIACDAIYSFFDSNGFCGKEQDISKNPDTYTIEMQKELTLVQNANRCRYKFSDEKSRFAYNEETKTIFIFTYNPEIGHGISKGTVSILKLKS
ncbi:hypothetical protein [uncultured Treponema sp.]|uniref:hypothetical protein n=1 Tax=uncultured Treponema sp. TaxID=162155 RepID=UPI0025DD57A2|nr:hypothetical protein [uncultured Treponema sp.]